MTGRILGATVLVAIVAGAGTAQASLAPPTYNVNTDLDLDVEWIWTLDDEDLNLSFMSPGPEHWSIDLDLSFLTDDENGFGSVGATVTHLTDFGSGAGGSAGMSVNFAVFNGTATTESETAGRIT